jgi:hypothetical protein
MRRDCFVAEDCTGLFALAQIQAIAEGGVDRLVHQAEKGGTLFQERSFIPADLYETLQPLEEESLEWPGRASAASAAAILGNGVGVHDTSPRFVRANYGVILSVDPVFVNYNSS